MMPLCYFFDNLVKKLDNLSTSNIYIYPSTLGICINNLLKLFFFGSRPPPYPKTLPETTPPENHPHAPYFQQNQHIYLQSVFRLSFQSNAFNSIP